MSLIVSREIIKSLLIVVVVLSAALFVGLWPYILRESLKAEEASEPPPISYLNVPFPVNEPVYLGEPLGTEVERMNHTNTLIVTTVARRLVDETTGEITTLQGNSGPVPAGYSKQSGGVGLPAPCERDGQRGCVTAGHVYHIEQFISMPGRYKTHVIETWTVSFVVLPKPSE